MKRNNDIENTLDNIEIEYSNDLLEENNENDDDIVKEKKPSLFRKLFFTLIKLANGLLTPSSGEILIDGRTPY